MNEQTKKQIFILDGQLIGCILYIVSLIVSIIIILDQRKKTLEKEGYLTSEEAQQLTKINKIAILILIIFFLYLNYETLDLAKESQADTENIELQIIASYLSIIVALIGIYVVEKNSKSKNLTPAEFDNPYI